MKPLRELPRFRGQSVLAIEVERGQMVMLSAGRQRLFDIIIDTPDGAPVAALDEVLDPFDFADDDPWGFV